MQINRRNAILGLFTFAACIAAIWFSPAPKIAAANIPGEISDEVFWRMIEDFSEAGGFFRSDNFVSNEWDFQYVVPELRSSSSRGGVYLGVGPDQNFTYVAALEPKIAFIVDIRRQNMIQHLMYKALIELSADRVDFLSRLFSRPRPDDLDVNGTADALLQAFIDATPNHSLFVRNLELIENHLANGHRFGLTQEDLESLKYVYSAFFEGGPHLTYSFSSGQGAVTGYGRLRGFGPRGMPTYAQLMMRTDQDGHNRSYLANAENFQILQRLQKKNLIIPIVGDFAGPKALRSIASYLASHEAIVTAFYTSNVEQYLFQQSNDWRQFYSNVATLPLDDQSTFIRSVASGRRYLSTGSRASLLSPIKPLLHEFRSERLNSYQRVIRMSH